jgi:hypothetical protein
MMSAGRRRGNLNARPWTVRPQSGWQRRGKERVMGMVRRRARRRTALVVGGAAYAAGRHGGRRAQREDDDYDDQQGYQEPPPAPPPPAPTTGPSDTDELARLGELHTNGTLTDEEFAAAKANILGT